jgi:hypothetical protein
MEPTTCVPRTPHSMPQPTAAADPLLLPPGVRLTSQGLRVPRGWEEANSVVTVLPTMTAPDSRSPLHAGGVEPREVAVEQRRTHTRDHVRGIDHVFHADRHAVDCRKRRVGPPTCRRGFRCGAGPLRVDCGEGGDRRLPPFNPCQAFLQHLFRRIGAAGERGGAADIGATLGCLSHETSSLQELRPRQAHRTRKGAGGKPDSRSCPQRRCRLAVGGDRRQLVALRVGPDGLVPAFFTNVEMHPVRSDELLIRCVPDQAGP